MFPLYLNLGLPRLAGNALGVGCAGAAGAAALSSDEQRMGWAWKLTKGRIPVWRIGPEGQAARWGRKLICWKRTAWMSAEITAFDHTKAMTPCLGLRHWEWNSRLSLRALACCAQSAAWTTALAYSARRDPMFVLLCGFCFLVTLAPPRCKEGVFNQLLVVCLSENAGRSYVTTGLDGGRRCGSPSAGAAGRQSARATSGRCQSSYHEQASGQ